MEVRRRGTVFLKAVAGSDDINGDLVNFYRVLQNHMEEFVRQWALSSRQAFKWL
jgi:site-specific DNA-adenine methylase